jgi:hypothetical protein
MQFGRLLRVGGCGVIAAMFAGCEPPAVPTANSGAPAGLQAVPAPPPPPENGAASNGTAVPSAPPAPQVVSPAPPPAGNFGDPAPASEVPPPIAPSDINSAAPSVAPPAEVADPAATASSGRAALDAYIAVEDEMYALLGTVTDAASAQAAAPKLQELATRVRPLVRPYWLALVGLSNEEKNEFVLQRAMKLRAAEAGPGGNIRKVTALMKQPGGEEFKAAFVAFLRAASEEAPRLQKAAAEKQIAELQ